MKSWEHIHWFLTSRCNLKCDYCFKPQEKFTEDAETVKTLAEIISDSRIKRVTLGGGEPTLVKSLDSALEILKKKGIYTSLHTNGLALSPERIKELSGLVDDIALPLDSRNRSHQEALRGRKFMELYDRLPELIDMLHSEHLGLGYHSVFTTVNRHDLGRVYNFIKKHGFDYWRVYEFNYDLVHRPAIVEFRSGSQANNALTNKIQAIEKLHGFGSPEAGFTDCISADFFLAEERFEKRKDSRIKFVGVRDLDKQTYTFLDNTGNISYYAHFSGSERRVLGNIIQDKTFLNEKLMRLHQQLWHDPTGFDDKAEEEFINAFQDRPLWQRMYEGNYWDEEFEEIKPEYMAKFRHLVRRFVARDEEKEKAARILNK